MTFFPKTCWRTTVAATAVLLAALAGCANNSANGLDTPDNAGGVFESKVDVDTAELRAIKKQAGIEPCQPGVAAGRPTAGLPDITLSCLGGGQDVDLGSLRGPLVVNLWAQWCGPCREELPYYQRLHVEAGDVVDLIGVDYQDTQPGAALEMAAAAGVTYPLLADPGAALRVPLKVRGLPGVVFVDGDGKVTHVEYVVIRSYDQLQDLVEEHLDVTLTGPR